MSAISQILKTFLAIVVLVLCVPMVPGQKTPKFLPLPNVTLQPVLTGLAQPIFVTGAGDGTGRLFIVLQRGRILSYDPATKTTTTFLDISNRVSQTGSERGLLGLAFHPRYFDNGYFFVNYTRLSDGATIVARYQGHLTGDPNSESVLLSIPQPYANHNGGMMAFGPDLNLYIGLGDGGSANDPQANSQNLQSLLGKLLRISIPPGFEPLATYTIPSTNPFFGSSSARGEIYAYGLRNPWRWSFDRGTGDLWLADVGQNAIEEVNKVVLGGNYGWRIYEGTQCTNIQPSLCTPSNFAMPVFEYNHSNGRCSVTGGYVYRGRRGTFPKGTYIYGDYCTGEIFIWRGRQQVLLDTSRFISSFGEDGEGEIYVVGIGSTTSPTGTVEKFVGSRK